MKTCKRCGASKPAQEFLYDSDFVCRSCHLWNAMHWKELPYQDEVEGRRRKLKLTPEQREQRRKQAKTVNGGRSDGLRMLEAR